MPVLEFVEGIEPCAPVVVAVSNLVFSHQAEPTFVYVVDPNSCAGTERDLYLAQHDGNDWQHTFLLSNSIADPYYWTVFDSPGPGFANVAIAFETDGTLSIAIGADGRGEVILYLRAVPACACDCPGDINGDGTINGLDIQGFSDCFQGQSGTRNCACADVDGDDDIDLDDRDELVQMVLQGATCPPVGGCVPAGYDIENTGGGTADCSAATGLGPGGSFTCDVDFGTAPQGTIALATIICTP